MFGKSNKPKNVDTGLLEELGWTPMKWWSRRNRSRFVFVFLVIAIMVITIVLSMYWFGKLTMDNQPLMIILAVTDILLISIAKHVYPHVTNPWKSDRKKMMESPFTGKKEIIKQQSLIRQERAQIVQDVRRRKMEMIQKQQSERPSLYRSNDIEDDIDYDQDDEEPEEF